MPGPSDFTLTPGLRAAIARWGRLWDVVGLLQTVTIEASPRLTRSLARCVPERGLVRIATEIRDGGDRTLREVLCHELAHIAVHRLHGAGARPHGSEWEELVRAAGYVPTTRLGAGTATTASARPDAAVAPPSPRRRAIYIHRCPVCQMMRRARRPVTGWRCADCVAAGLDGALHITRVAEAGGAR